MASVLIYLKNRDYYFTALIKMPTTKQPNKLNIINKKKYIREQKMNINSIMGDFNH